MRELKAKRCGRYLWAIFFLVTFLPGCNKNPSGETPQDEVFDFFSDTLAVRRILDLNNLFSVKVISVTDSAAGRITGLRLDSFNLSILPENIGKLTALAYLNVSKNGLANIPTEISYCKELTYINLNDNKLNCPPNDIGNLPKVKTLLIKNNVLLDIPGSISFYPGLDTLDLSHNRIDSLPSEFTRLKSLKYLDLGFNKLKNLTGELKTWADTYDPDWLQTQLNY
jgi:Leucine-rich repeat (LRR) protein